MVESCGGESDEKAELSGYYCCWYNDKNKDGFEKKFVKILARDGEYDLKKAKNQDTGQYLVDMIRTTVFMCYSYSLNMYTTIMM